MHGKPFVTRARSRSSSASRLRFLLAVAFAMIAAAVLPPATASAATNICSNQTGNNGYYYQMWSAGQGSACININSGTSYTTNWSGIGGAGSGGGGGS
jgi:endo-1,4-beta-xylanase